MCVSIILQFKRLMNRLDQFEGEEEDEEEGGVFESGPAHPKESHSAVNPQVTPSKVYSRELSVFIN